MDEVSRPKLKNVFEATPQDLYPSYSDSEPGRSTFDTFLALLNTEDAADAFTDAHASVSEEFLTETDYTTKSVVVIQIRDRNTYSPNVRHISCEEGYVTVWLRKPNQTPKSGGGGHEQSDKTRTFLVRVHRGPTPPGEARCEFAYPGGTRFDSISTGVPGAEPFDRPRPIYLLNRDCAAMQFSLILHRDGSFLSDERYKLSPASAQTVPKTFDVRAPYTVSVNVRPAVHGRSKGQDQFSKEATRMVSGGDLATSEAVLVSVAGDGTPTIELTTADQRPQAGPTCEAESRPYESPNPAENMGDPVEFSYHNWSDTDRRPTVTIRDADTIVFQRKVTERKIHLWNLLAKKTTYTVEVNPEEGQTVTESVRIRSGMNELRVDIRRDGEITIDMD